MVNLFKSSKKLTLDLILSAGLLGSVGCASFTNLDQPVFKATFLESKLNRDNTYKLTFKEYNPQQHSNRNKVYHVISEKNTDSANNLLEVGEDYKIYTKHNNYLEKSLNNLFDITPTAKEIQKINYYIVNVKIRQLAQN